MKPKLISLKSLYVESIPRRGYLTHGFDSYPAKMIPHMARFLINEISTPGQTILDPFCGTGAVLIESLVTGRNAIGVDLNPLAILLAKAKTATYDTRILEAQLEEILEQFAKCQCPCKYNFPNARYWFTDGTLRKLGVIKTVLDHYLPNIDSDYANFWRALAASIVRECSRADTRGAKPFISKRSRTKRFGRHFNPFKIFQSKAHLWISAGEQYAKELKEISDKTRADLIEGDSRNLSHLLNGQVVDAVVTSPPYLSAQDYYRASKLQLFVLEYSCPGKLIEWSRELIGSDRITLEQRLLDSRLPCLLAEQIKCKLANRNKKNAYVFVKYVLDISKVLDQINRLLKTGSQCAIVSGYNLSSGIVIPTPEVIIQLASERGFRLACRYRDKIRDRWLPTIRNGHNGVIDEEHLLVFSKVT